MDITTQLTGTLAVAVDSLPGTDTELAVVESRGKIAPSIDQHDSMGCSCRRGGSSE